MGASLQRLKNQLRLISKRPDFIEVKSSEVFPQDQNTETVIQRCQGCISSWQQNLIICRYPTGCWFGLHESCRTEKVLESTRDLTLCETRGGRWWSCDSVAMKLQWSCSIVEMPGLWEDHQGQQQVWSGSQTEPVRQAACVVAARAGEVGHPRALEPSRSWLSPRCWKMNYLLC